MCSGTVLWTGPLVRRVRACVRGYGSAGVRGPHHPGRSEQACVVIFLTGSRVLVVVVVVVVIVRVEVVVVVVFNSYRHNCTFLADDPAGRAYPLPSPDSPSPSAPRQRALARLLARAAATWSTGPATGPRRCTLSSAASFTLSAPPPTPPSPPPAGRVKPRRRPPLSGEARAAGTPRPPPTARRPERRRWRWRAPATPSGRRGCSRTSGGRSRGRRRGWTRRRRTSTCCRRGGWRSWRGGTPPRCGGCGNCARCAPQRPSSALGPLAPHRGRRRGRWPAAGASDWEPRRPSHTSHLTLPSCCFAYSCQNPLFRDRTSHPGLPACACAVSPLHFDLCSSPSLAFGDGFVSFHYFQTGIFRLCSIETGFLLSSVRSSRSC